MMDPLENLRKGIWCDYTFKCLSQLWCEERARERVNVEEGDLCGGHGLCSEGETVASRAGI